MEPTEALIQAEISLRNLIRDVLGNSWLDVPGVPTRSALSARRNGDVANRHGVSLSDDPIDYLYIGELYKIISQRRGKLGSPFPDIPRFDQLVRILVGYRNVPFHARTLNWFERDLVTGSAGYIVACVTKWRNQNQEEAGSSLEYAQILSAKDDLGNDLVIPGPETTTLSGGKRDVGQVVQFECAGVDVDNRPIHWELWVSKVPLNGSQNGKRVDTAIGESALLAWKIEPEDFSDKTFIAIRIKTSDENYPPRFETFDTQAWIYYTIRRPRVIENPSSWI